MGNGLFRAIEKKGPDKMSQRNHKPGFLPGRSLRWASGLFLLTVFILQGCDKENRWDFFKRTGEMVLVEREVLPFTDIVVGNNKVNIYITQDSNFSVKVQAGKNLVDLVTTEVREGRLYVEDNNKCNFMRSYKYPINVFIHMPRVLHIFHAGAGLIQSTNVLTGDTIDVITKSSGDVDLTVNCYRVSTHLHSVGDVYLSGTCSDNICFATGNAFLYSQNLVSGYGWVFSNTSGQIYVNITGWFIVTIKSLGDVYCRGNPPIVEETYLGSGKLIMQ
jgi:hypothetical protein